MKNLSKAMKRIVTLLIGVSILLASLPAQAELQSMNVEGTLPTPGTEVFSASTASTSIGTVGILSTTVTSGLSSPEALKAIGLGYTVDIITPAVWSGMTTADFATYDALILGDPTCEVGPTALAAAISNSAVWSAAVTGNVIVIGADPTYHYTYRPTVNAQTLIDNGVAFALDGTGTGAYITLSCYYHFDPPLTPVPVLDGFGSFIVTGAGTTGALNDVHIVASHPALAGITDSTLSNWGNSVHENFDLWPSNFEVLAIAIHSSGSYTSGDGSVGYPYILARGVIPDYCGDGVLNPGEQCDDGNNDGGDGCSATCDLEVCGNSVVDTGETCDDGNTDPGDGCDEVCQIEDNSPPVADAGGPYIVDEGTSVVLDASGSTDPDGDALTYEWDLNNDGTYETSGKNPTLTPEDGPVILTIGVQVDDGNGGVATDTTTVTVNNVAPTAEAGGPYSGDEGSLIALAGSATDPGADTLIYEWDLDNDGEYDDSTDQNPSHTWPDDGTFTVGLRVTDDDGGKGIDTATVTVNNVPPEITSLSSDTYLAPVGAPIQGTGTFHDPGILDTFTALWDWGDSTINSQSLPAGSTSTTYSHAYTTPGVYTVCLTVTDNDGGSDSECMPQYIVIYDPDGGFVTGGGWIDSPEGAYVADPSLTGTANFGFVSKYKKGATTPTGQTEFQFQAGDLNFHSSSYDWLVIANHKAIYKGTGTINGDGNYGFMLFAIDEKLTPSTDVDMFRIKIWDINNNDAVVYDNEIGEDEDAPPTTPIIGGSIVIHK